MHAKAGDGFNDVIALGAVAEDEKDWRHGAHVLDEGAQEQQVVLDPEKLAEHHPDHFHPGRHLDAGQLLDRQHVGQVVHDPAEVVDPVGVGDVAVPALPLPHLFRCPMVVADVRHAIENFLAIQLQHEAEGTMGAGVVGT